MKLVVLDGYALNPGDLSWDSLGGLVQLHVYDRTGPEDLLSRAKHAELILLNKIPIRESTMEALPDLRYIGVLATGYDVIDTAAAKRRGIVVTNIPTYGTDSVAQFAFALLLELCHRVQRHADSTSEGEWARSPDWCYYNYPLMELAGKTMGIVGFGRIGRRVGDLANAFGMRVLAHDTFQGNAPSYEGFAWATQDEIFAQSDVLSLHCPLTAGNRGMVNRESLSRMKSNAILLNTSRGALVVEKDLADALRDGKIAAAALDVLSEEPPTSGSPLLYAPNCLVTPHIAWATKEARARLLATAVENVAAFLKGEPQNVVNS